MGFYKHRSRYTRRSLNFMYLFPLFVARLIKRGLKQRAYFLAKCAIGYAKFLVQRSGLVLLETVFEILLPRIDICPRVIAGRTLYIPCPIRRSKDIKLALNWLLSNVPRSRAQSYSFPLSLGYLFAQTFFFEGAAISRRNEHYSIVKRNSYLLAKMNFRVLIPF